MGAVEPQLAVLNTVQCRMLKAVFILILAAGSGCGSPGKRAGVALDRSLLSMFDAFQAENSQRNEKLMDKHSHDDDDYDELHDGQGGHSHDDDGHTHQEFRVRSHAQDHTRRTNPGVVHQLHDGPGGHHHYDDGHNHKRHTEADTNSEEGKESTEDLRKFTLIISKLLFQLSKM